MNSFGNMKKVLVCLDETDMDPVIIKFGEYFARHLLKVDEIHFVSAYKPQSFYEELDESLTSSLDEQFEQRIKYIDKQVSENTGKQSSIKRIIMLLKGHPLDEILKYAEKANIDLVILGKKPGSLSTGILAQKLTRKLSRSVLLVPNVAVPFISSTLLPVDFSHHSVLAINFAKGLQNLDNSLTYDLLHVYDVPLGYTNTGKTLKEMVEIMREKSLNFWRKFCRKNEYQPEEFNFSLIFNRMNSCSSHIREHLTNSHYDFLILGSKGQSNSSYFLLGSETEKVIYDDIDVPVLILKVKGENIDIWDAIKKL